MLNKEGGRKVHMVEQGKGRKSSLDFELGTVTRVRDCLVGVVEFPKSRVLFRKRWLESALIYVMMAFNSKRKFV